MTGEMGLVYSKEGQVQGNCWGNLQDEKKAREVRIAWRGVALRDENYFFAVLAGWIWGIVEK